MNIFLLRHAEVKSNTLNAMSVSVDEKLTAHGLQQAKLCCAKLSAYKFDHILCSPLPRALETISFLPRETSANVQVISELAEGHLMLGKPPEAEVPAYKKHPEYGKIPIDQETSGQFIGRALLAKKIITELNPANMLVVSHGHMIRELINQFLELKTRIRFPHANCGFTSISIDEHISVNFMNRKLCD